MKQLEIFKNKVKYSIDTSAILDGYNRYYPPDVFPALWKNIEILIKNGDLKATEIVLQELKIKKDDTYKWAEQQKEGLFVPIDESIQKTVSKIMEKYPRILAESKKNKRNKADPFVIALAKKHGATVISGEKEGSENKPKIPFICQNFKIKHITFLQFIRTEEWSL